MSVVTILPVSRTEYLDRVLGCLDRQTMPIENLVIVIEGDINVSTAGYGFKSVKVIKSPNRVTPTSTHERRGNISNIHNMLREHVNGFDWVFSVEDDGIIPDDSLERLYARISDDVGMVTGVELGRWGLPYVGAWTVNDVNNTTEISSLLNKSNSNDFDEIDACGLYCALIRTDLYRRHNFNADNKLGPDVNLGLSMRQLGYKNYIDWGIHVTHLGEKNGEKFELKATDISKIVTMKRSGNEWYGLHF